MGLRLVELFRSVLEDLATGRGSVIVEPLDLGRMPAAPEPDDTPPAAWRTDVAVPGLAPA